MPNGQRGKNDVCWSCATRLDQPYQGRRPAKCGCSLSDCVVCPKCGATLCSRDSDPKAAARSINAQKVKALVGEGAALAASGSGGSGGSGSMLRGSRVHLPAVDSFPV